MFNEHSIENRICSYCGGTDECSSTFPNCPRTKDYHYAGQSKEGRFFVFHNRFITNMNGPIELFAGKILAELMMGEVVMVQTLPCHTQQVIEFLKEYGAIENKGLIRISLASQGVANE